MLLAPYVCFHNFSSVQVTEWPPIGKIAIRLTISFHGISTVLLIYFFPISVFGVGIFFLIAPFPDLFLHVPFDNLYNTKVRI